MQRILTFLLPVALAFGFVGCNSLTQKNADQCVNQEAKLDFGDEMLNAMQRGIYADFSRDFSKELKESVPEAAFRKLCMDLKSRNESLANWKRLDTLDRGGLYHTEVWKIVLLKSGKTGKSRIERLFYVTTAKLDGKTAVIGLKFDPLF